jgi:hypothetical protein
MIEPLFGTGGEDFAVLHKMYSSPTPLLSTTKALQIHWINKRIVVGTPIGSRSRLATSSGRT